MSKKSLIISIIIICSLVLGALSGWYFYLRQQAGPNADNFITAGKFFDFGSPTPTTTPPETVTPSETTTSTPIVTITVPKPIPALRHLTSAPVAGAAFINKELISTSTTSIGTSTKTNQRVIGTVEVFRWVDRATGNISETSSSTLETTRISNVTVPKIYEAYFVNSKGTDVIFRDLIEDSDAIRTRYGVLQSPSATSSELVFKFTELPVNITQIALSPTADQIFSILPTNTRGAISRPDGSNNVNVFNSVFHEWLVSWPSSQTVVLNTKPSGTAEGYAYTFDTKTRALSKLVGNKKGLTTLMSPDGAYVLVGESPQGTVQLNVLDRKTGIIKDLFVRTFPEKCVWSKKEKNTIFCAVPENISYGIYPDAWYMGIVSFSDGLWKINTITSEGRRVVHPVAEAGQDIDMINLSLSKNEDFIIFQNKSDLSLWSYQLIKPEVTNSSTASSTRADAPRP